MNQKEEPPFFARTRRDRPLKYKPKVEQEYPTALETPQLKEQELFEVEITVKDEEPTMLDIETIDETGIAKAVQPLAPTTIKLLLQEVMQAEIKSANRRDDYLNSTRKQSVELLILYLQEIGEIPFPSLEDQVILSQAIERGKFAQKPMRLKETTQAGRKAKKNLLGLRKEEPRQWFEQMMKDAKKDATPEDHRLGQLARRNFQKEYRHHNKTQTPPPLVLLRQYDDGLIAEKLFEEVKQHSNPETFFTEVVKNGKAAEHDLTKRNARLVVSIAKKYIGRSYLNFLDLIQEGNLGLMVAVQKYDWRLGYQFSTYATWWIRQQIEKAIVEAKEVPVHFHQDVIALNRRLNALEQHLHHEPDELEITFDMLSERFPQWQEPLIHVWNLIGQHIQNKHTELTTENIARLLENAWINGWAIPQADNKYIFLSAEVFLRMYARVRGGVAKIMRRKLFLARASLDSSKGDEGGDPAYLYDTIADPKHDGEEPSVATDVNLLRKNIENALEILTDGERAVLCCRFGLPPFITDHTLEETAMELNLHNRERVRQIEAKALRKLRHPTRSRELRAHLG